MLVLTSHAHAAPRSLVSRVAACETAHGRGRERAFIIRPKMGRIPSLTHVAMAQCYYAKYVLRLTKGHP